MLNKVSLLQKDKGMPEQEFGLSNKNVFTNFGLMSLI